MRKLLLIAAIICLAGARTDLSAGPFISINSIDAKSEFPRIKVNVSVVDPEQHGINGLDEQNIQVYEDGYSVNYVKVKNISSPKDSLHLVFAIDSSKSISGPFLDKIKKDAKDIVDSAGEHDRIAVYRFNDRVMFLNNFTSNRHDLIQSIKSVNRHGTKTLLYDAIYDAIELLSAAKSVRKGVVIFTDGKDEGSSVNPDDVVKFSRDTGIPVYFITSAPQSKTQHIARIAKLTGGVLVSDGCKDVAGFYRKILSRIKNIYEINYLSIIKKDDTAHNLEVRLRYGDLKDRDTAEFTVGRDFLKLDFPEGSYIILSILVLGLLVILFILLIVFFKRSKERYSKMKRDNYNDDSSIDENLRAQSISAESLIREESYSDAVISETPDVMYSQVWLHQKEGKRAGKKIQILKPEITIGSGSENIVQVEDPEVSDRHARIRRVEGGYYLFDLISDNGTYLNGKKLLRPKLLHDWDEIKTGNSIFIFRGIK